MDPKSLSDDENTNAGLDLQTQLWNVKLQNRVLQEMIQDRDDVLDRKDDEIIKLRKQLSKLKAEKKTQEEK